ncbi:MAG TPA: hypothetical protein PLT35_02595, partial [Vicinamibacterales bacterium]|nr:hypothetical protein [Vicinamibacterales bacterium]
MDFSELANGLAASPVVFCQTTEFFKQLIVRDLLVSVRCLLFFAAHDDSVFAPGRGEALEYRRETAPDDLFVKLGEFPADSDPAVADEAEKVLERSADAVRRF